MTETIKAYVAGLIDGEGYVALHRTKTKFKEKEYISYRPIVTITNTVLEPLKFVQSYFGGKIVLKKPTGCMKKICYSVRFRGKHSKLILEEVLPYLIIKKQKAIELLEYVNIRYGKNKKNIYSVEEIAKAESFIRRNQFFTWSKN